MTGYLFGALDLATDKMYGHVKRHKRRAQFLEFCRYLRSLYPNTTDFRCFRLSGVLR